MASGPKLLLDQNLSHRLVSRIEDLYPGSTHVRAIGLAAAADELVWAYALEHGFMIVSKDADFHQRSFVRGAPPKVVWVRRGNCATSDIEVILRTYQAEIIAFAGNATATFLTLL